MLRKTIVLVAATCILGGIGLLVLGNTRFSGHETVTKRMPAFSQASPMGSSERKQLPSVTSIDGPIRTSDGPTSSWTPATDAAARFRRQMVSANPNELAVAMHSAMQCSEGRYQRAEAASRGLDMSELFRALPDIVQRAISQAMAADAGMFVLCDAMGANRSTALDLGSRIGENSLAMRLSSIRAPSRTAEPGSSQQREEERRATLLDLAAPTEDSITALQIGAGNLVRMAIMNGALKGADANVNPAILEALIACGAGADCAGDSLNRLYFCSLTNGLACGGVTVNDSIRNALSVSEQDAHNRAVQQISEAIRSRNTKFFGL